MTDLDSFTSMPKDKWSTAARAISFLANCAFVVVLVGCATSARPLPTTKRIALTPPPDDIAMRAQVGDPIGEIVPVDVSIANGTDEPYLIDTSQVFAIDEQGERILPVPPSEAMQEAGNANDLKAGLVGAGKSAAAGAVTGAVVGAALGAGAGALVGVPPVGAAFGAVIGGGIGAATAGGAGAMEGEAAAHVDAATQISALCLKSGEAHPSYSVNGYVFFPKGTYRGVQVTLLNEENEQTRTMTAIWTKDGATALASEPNATSNKPPRIESQDTE